MTVPVAGHTLEGEHAAMEDGKHGTDRRSPINSSILDSVRQLCFPAEFRIAAPPVPLDSLEGVEVEPQSAPAPQTDETAAAASDSAASNQLVAELATCLWYLKTKHFKREWDDPETGDDNPRVRRALNRMNKSMDVLKENGIEVCDPTNKRYPPGGEGMMRPIQFLPTPGLTFEVVSETVAPIIYRDDRLIQRGEVFVAVPKEGAAVAVRTTTTVTPTEPEAAGGAPPEGISSQAEAQTSTPPAEEPSEAPGVAAAKDDGCDHSRSSPEAVGTASENPRAEAATGESTQSDTPGAGADGAVASTPAKNEGDRSSTQEPTGKGD
ncbi:MAG: hypothetical protein ACOC8H_01915 [bacterium]